MAAVVLLGTCDTKLQELLFLKDQIQLAQGVNVMLIDVGRTQTDHESISISHSRLLSQCNENGPTNDDASLSRSEVIKLMAACASAAVKDLHASSTIHGIIAAGGSGNTSLASTVMRDALPMGFPKMIVSTVASGDVGPIVGETDITLMYSIVDIAGLNQILRDVLGNAAAAIAGAALAYAGRRRKGPGSTRSGKTRVGITMFGVTTPGVDAIRKHLEAKYEVETFIFHATGHGGKAMERLIQEGMLDAVIDLTTTEICDLITGGVMSAGPTRLQAASEAGIPYIVSLGATDMTNFGPKSTVPERYKDRLLYEHNEVITLMRSSEDECRQIGGFICRQLRQHVSKPDAVEVWLPKGGVSMLSVAGGPFENSRADEILFRELSDGLIGSGIRLIEDDRDVNDAGFAMDIADALMKLTDITHHTNL